jgi:hypothetical protein
MLVHPFHHDEAPQFKREFLNLTLINLLDQTQDIGIH